MPIGEFILRLIPACMPITGIIILIVVINVTTKKHRESIAADLLSGLRSPTDYEAESILMQVKPRAVNKAIVTAAIFLPLTVIAAGAAISGFYRGERMMGIGLSCVSGAILLFGIGLMAQPLSEIKELKNRLYCVCDCNIAEIHTYTRYIRRSFIPVTIYHAVIKDLNGYIWESDLPKDLQDVRAGTNCLVIIYAAEDKVNRNRKEGRYIYRRDIYVEK